MKAFGTFKGGGVKGLAHVGAYKAADEKGIEFIGVAGTSAGSIVAALIAVGFTPDELYDAGAANAVQTGPFGEPYTQFFDMALWNRTKSCGEALSSIGRDLLLSNGTANNSAVSSTSASIQTSTSKKRHYVFWKRTPDAKKVDTRKNIATYASTAVLVMCLLSPCLMPFYKRYSGRVYFVCFVLTVVWLVLLVCSNAYGKGLLVLLLLLFFCACWKIKNTINSYAQHHHDLTTNLPPILISLVQERGLFPTQSFTDWLDKLLKNKISHGSGENGSVLFKDIQDRMPLKIIAANVTDQSITVFSQEDTPDARIIDAVAASISIPVIFQPKSYFNMEYVDGGLVSNIPAWALDDERAKAGIQVPTLVFKLEEWKNVSSASIANAQDKPLDVFARLLKQLLTTLLEGDENLQYRQVGNLHIVPLKVDVSMLEIELNDHQRRALYDAGFRQANNYLNQVIGPSNPEEMEKVILSLVHDRVLQKARTNAKHLRVAVMLKICKNSSVEDIRRRYLIRVCYSYNMTNDADDQMELDMEAGGAGQCWRERKLIFVDMVTARHNFASTYHMTKYQQALVRPSLKALLCIPIFAEDETAGTSTELVGLLCLDTDDENLCDIFKQVVMPDTQDLFIEKVRETVVECGIPLGKYLRDKR